MTRVIIGAPVWSLNGVNTFSANLARGLGAEGYDASILLTGVTYRERKPLAYPADIEIEQLGIPRLATWRRRWDALIQYLEQRSPCIYLPNYDFRHSCVTSTLSADVGVVGIVHSDDPRHYDHAARMGASWNACVAVSGRIAKRIRDAGSVPENRLEVIPYGVAHSPEVAPRQETGPIRLIYTGRLDAEQKRVGDLLLIAAELRGRRIEFVLTIVGDGPEHRKLERWVTEHGLADCVTIVKSVSNPAVIEMCASSDAFILPSAFEGMPISLLEAMGQGCIAIATTIESGVPELVREGRNGFTVPVGDIAAFADRIALIASSRDTREEMRLDAWRTVAVGEYRTTRMIERYSELFARVSKEMQAGTFRRQGFISPVELSVEERVAAPLWAFRPDMRKQLLRPR